MAGKKGRSGGRPCSPKCRCGKHRGGPRPASVKKKISDSHRKRAKRIREEQRKEPDRKLCNRCKKWKILPDDFYYKINKLADGTKVKYPASECKKCSNKRTKQWWNEREKEGRKREIERRYARNHRKKIGKQNARARDRERRTIERRQKGSKPSGGQYEDKGTGKRMPKEPFSKFVSEIQKSRRMTLEDIAIRAGLDHSQLKRSLTPGSGENLTLGTIDRVLLALDREEMLTILYDE